MSGRPVYDEVIQRIADYVLSDEVASPEAYSTARLCLLDALGCAQLALQFPACTRVLQPTASSDPVATAFNLGTRIRWLDYNDTWLAAEWGHPSDNFGGLLAVGQALTVHQLLTYAIKAYEIQGILALHNSFNRVGIDHVILVRVATAAVTTHMLGGNRDAIMAAISQAWVDGGSLRCYRHAPNTGSRKSWAAGDATSRGVWLALLSRRGEMGYPTALTAPHWGFYDAFFKGHPFSLPQPFGCYVMENILFKVAYPAEFHAQTAVEAAIQLHPQLFHRLDDIDTIILSTQEAAVRIIDKRGPLHNPADRDHCLQYMVAIGMIFGTLNASHYEDETAGDPRIDRLRALMIVAEDPQFTRDYLDPHKRSIANGIAVRFRDGSTLPPVMIEYPLGHRRRREEAIPRLMEKFEGCAGIRELLKLDEKDMGAVMVGKLLKGIV